LADIGFVYHIKDDILGCGQVHQLAPFHSKSTWAALATARFLHDLNLRRRQAVKLVHQLIDLPVRRGDLGL
jgi:hypothetical protein